MLPIAPASKRPPKGFSWEPYQHRLPDEAEIEQWWRQWPRAGVGIITGKISNLVVLDVDTRKGADANAIFEQYPTGSVCRTGSGGGHFYYAYPSDQEHISNAVGRENGQPNGLDLRADGGYVVAPPTLHPSGQRYEWLDRHHPNPIPRDLLARVLPQPATGNGKTDHPTEPWLADVLAGVDEGGRNDAAARLCGYYFSKGMPADVVEHHLLLWNQNNQPPLSPGRIRLTVESINRTRQRQRVNAPVSAAVDLQDGEQDAFQLMPLGRYMATFGDNAISWQVEGWLPDETIAMIVSPPGTFKTWMLLDLAVSLSTGTPFLGIAPVASPGPVLVVQQEDHHGEIAERLAVILKSRDKQIGARGGGKGRRYIVHPPPSPPIYLHPNRELRFGDAEVMDALEARVKEIRPRAVLIDPLYTTVDMKSGDYLAGAVNDLMRLKLMRDRYGTSFVLAHHTTKRSQDSTREDLWGSQILNAFLETGWQIRPKDATSAVIRRHFKVAKNVEESVLSFDISTIGATKYQPSLMAKSEADDTAAEKIATLLREGGATMKQVDLAKEIRMDEGTVSRACKVLQEQERIIGSASKGWTTNPHFNVKTDH